MTLKIEKYIRKPFLVDAVQVTEENIHDVAKWCGGDVLSTVKTLRDENNKVIGKTDANYVKVGVHRPLNERQTKAFAGDWVLKSESGLKVYTINAFDSSFEPRAAEDKQVSLNTDTAAIADAAQKSVEN